MTGNNGKTKIAIACALILAGLACLGGFIWLEHWLGGFSDRHGHGRTVDGAHRIFFFTCKEWWYFGALFIFALPGAVSLGLGLSRLAGARLDNIGKTALEHDLFSRRFLDFGFAAAVIIAIVAILTRWGVPITDDAVSYSFQACVLAGGNLTAPVHPVREAFDGIFIVNTTTRYAMYTFGFPMLLAPAVFIGLIKVVPVLLTLGTVVLIYKIALKLWGDKVARVAFVLALLGPQMLFTASTLTSQTASAFFLALGVYLLIRSGEEGAVFRSALGAGAAFGAALNVRPSSAFIWALPVGFMLIIDVFRRRRGGKKTLVRLAGVAAAGAVLLCMYCGLNWHVNGSPFKSNYRAYLERAEPEIGQTMYIGFGKYPWDIEHTATAGLRNVGMNLLRLNAWQFGMPVGILLVILGIAAGWREKWVKVFLGIIAFTFVFYFFYFWPGICETGPVLYYELLIPCVLLGAVGLKRGLKGLASRLMGKEKPGKWFSPAAFFFAFLLVAVVTFHRVQFNTLRHTRKEVMRLYYPVANKRDEFGEKKVIILHAEPLQPEPATSWVMGRIVHSLTFNEPVIFARDAGPEVARRLMEAYPDRDFYRLEAVPSIQLPDGTLQRAPGGRTRIVRIPR